MAGPPFAILTDCDHGAMRSIGNNPPKYFKVDKQILYRKL